MRTAPVQKVVAYVRVSTEQQADRGNSLEAQEEKLAMYCRLHGLELVATKVDAGLSASTLDRPALQEALTMLESGEAQGMVVVKLDRLTRSVKDLCELVERYFQKHALMSVSESVDTSTASGRLVLNILATVSQWEREAAAERTAAVMSHLKATGRFTGGFPPYGYAVDEEGALVENPAETAILVQARAFKEAGMSLRTIAASLPHNPRTGKRFAASQIARMV